MKAQKTLEPKQQKTFRDKYLAVVFAAAALLISSIASAQLDSAKYSPINGYGFKYKRMVFDSILMIPRSTSPHVPWRAGAIRYNAPDSTLQLWTGSQWNSILTGIGNGIDTMYVVEDTNLVVVTFDETFVVKVGKRHVDSLYRKAGQDSIFYQIAGIERAILDSMGAVQLTDSSFRIGNDTITIRGTGATLQQVFNQGSVLTKHDTIYQGRNVLAANGQFIVKDTNRVGESQSILIFGTSVDAGLVPPFNYLPTRWGSQVAGNLGLEEWNRALSGSTLIHHAAFDSCMFDRLYSIPNWNPSIRYIVIGTYPLNDVLYQDSSQYRTGLSAMIDSLHVNRGFPLQSIIVINSTPAPVRGSNLALLATAAIHVAMEKGVRYFDAYNYLLGESGILDPDNLHLNLKGHINLATGLLNSTVFDSVSYIMTNALQVQKGLTNNGFFMNRGSDSTLGRLYVGGNFNLVGNFEKAGNFLKGLSVAGDATKRSINIFNEPIFSERIGLRVGGTSLYHLDLYTSWGSSSDSVRLGRLAADGTTFTSSLSTSAAGTAIWTPLTVTGPSTFNNTSTFARVSTITGNTTTGAEWNLYRDGTFNEKLGVNMNGPGPFFTNVYTSWGSASNGVRLGWIANDGTTFNSVLTALKSGNVIVPGLASGGTAPTTSGTTKMVITDANGLLSFATTPSGADGNGIYSGNGSLSGNTTITGGSNTLTLTGTQSSNAAFSIQNTGAGNALSISSTGSGPTQLISNNSTGQGLQIVSADGVGLSVSTDNTNAATFTINPTTTNTTDRVVNVIRKTTGTAANNMGGSIGCQLEDDAGSTYSAAQIKFIQTNASAASRTTAFTFSVLNAGTSNDRFTLAGSGQLKLHAYGTTGFSVTPATTPVFASDGTIGQRVAPKIYTALISQSGTSDPTAAVLGTNEIGSIVWTRTGAGEYVGTLSGAFVSGKTFVVSGHHNLDVPDAGRPIVYRANANEVKIKLVDTVASDGLTDLSIEIRVYP